MTNSEIFRFRLYVADNTLNSEQAMVNLREICNCHLPGRHTIELIDVLKDPERAMADEIFMTPTLIKLTPEPVERIVGNLSQTSVVLQALGLGGLAA